MITYIYEKCGQTWQANEVDNGRVEGGEPEREAPVGQ